MSQAVATRAVRVIEVEPTFSIEVPTGTFAFGASTVGALTLAHVRVRVEDLQGRGADGWGAVFLSYPWAFPGDVPDAGTKDRLLRLLISAYGLRLAGAGEWGHPLDHFLAIESDLATIAASVAEELGIAVPIPDLATLVAFSSIDAALHDAYGRLHGLNSFHLLGKDDLGWDLSRVLGPGFTGKYPADFLRREPVARLPISHTVGAADPLTAADADPDGMPALEAWIRRDGVRSFKVKLKGQDLAWDIARLTGVNAVARAVMPDTTPHIFADLNEQAPSVDYIAALLDGVEADPLTWEALDALEQPLSRDLDRAAVSVAAISDRVPVVLDEGLTSLASIERAIDLGWTGIALKTCKTQSLMVLANALSQSHGLHVSVQDLTNPGIALLQSIGLAARLPVTRPLEANARQYYPHASDPEAAAFPEVFRVVDGTVAAGELTGPGLGFDVDRIVRGQLG